MRQCLAKYHDPGNFLTLFNPANQFAYTSDERRCYMGEAPSLAVVRTAWGNTIAEAWVEIQVKNLSEYAGCKEKLSDGQTEEIARVIMSEFGYMTVTQLMHFFVRFKAGRYGKFYGAVDGLVITEALQQFAQERYDIIRKYETEMLEEEAQEKKRIERAAVLDFNSFLDSLHLTIHDYRQFCEWGITDRQEIADLYWLVKI